MFISLVLIFILVIASLRYIFWLKKIENKDIQSATMAITWYITFMLTGLVLVSRGF